MAQVFDSSPLVGWQARERDGEHKTLSDENPLIRLGHRVTSALSNQFNHICNLGIEYTQNSEDARRLILINQISLFGLFAQLPFLIIHALEAQYIGILSNVVFMSFTFFTWILNSKGKIITGKMFMMISPNFSVFSIHCLYGKEFPDISFNYLSIVILQFWLSGNSPQERRLLRILLTITFGMFFLTKAQLSVFDMSHLSNLSPLATAVCHVLTPTVSIYFVFVGSLLFWQDRIEAEKKLMLARQRSDNLLYNVLPVGIAEQLKDGKRHIAEHYPMATVLFADLSGFTRIASSLSPQELVEMLDAIFTSFDKIAEKHGVEKIKTIGDAYMLVGGIPNHCPYHAVRVANAALEMLEALSNLPNNKIIGLTARIGIHSGEVVAGVIGHTKFSYDLWGDTVNIASRMESHGEPGKIHCSNETYHLLRDHFSFVSGGTSEIKGKGQMETWYLNTSPQKSQSHQYPYRLYFSTHSPTLFESISEIIPRLKEKM